LPIGVEVMEALRNKRCLRVAIGVPSSFVLADFCNVEACLVSKAIFRQP